MASPAEVTIIQSILQEQIACHFPELVNRAYLFHALRQNVVKTASIKLQAEGKADARNIQAKDSKKTKIYFIYSTDYPTNTINKIIDQKIQLLAKHYDLSDVVGKHGEAIVAQACANLGYTDIETRKEKHASTDLGISKRDIDVFAKHPSGNYYQNIEVKNRRDPLKDAEVGTIVQTTKLATSRWNLQIKPAVVTTFATGTASDAAKIVDLPIAYAPQVSVPARYTDLYTELNDRLALNVAITDDVPAILQQRIHTWIMQQNYG